MCKMRSFGFCSNFGDRGRNSAFSQRNEPFFDRKTHEGGYSLRAVNGLSFVLYVAYIPLERVLGVNII